MINGLFLLPLYFLNIFSILILSFFIIFKSKKIRRKVIAFLVLTVFSVDLLSYFCFYGNSPCVASDGWYDVYTAYTIHSKGMEYFDREYKYGYGYPFTLSLFFNFLDIVSILPVFSFFFFNIGLIFFYLSSYFLTRNEYLSFLFTLSFALNPLTIKYTFFFMGKEIFIQSFSTILLFSLIYYFSRKNFDKIKFFSFFNLIITILFISSIKSEFLLTLFVPLFILLKDKLMFRIDKKSAIKFILLAIILLYPNILFFIRQYRVLSTPGGNLEGKSLYTLFEYEIANIKEIIKEIFYYFQFFPLFIVYGVYKKDKLFCVAFLLFLVMLLPYAIYYPWIFESRYMVPISPIFIFLILFPLFSIFKRMKKSRILVCLILCTIIVSYFFASLRLRESNNIKTYCMYQDPNIYKDIIEKFGKDSIFITARSNQQMIIKCMGCEADSFEMFKKYINPNVYYNFYVRKITSCNKTYPFNLTFEKPTYFIESDICYCEGCIEKYLCDCIKKAYNSECFDFENITVCNITYPETQFE